MKIVADDKIPYLKGALEKRAEVHYIKGADISADDMKDADVLITRTRTKVNEQLLKDSKIKLVVTATIGHDHIDKDYLASRGIIWKNCPGCNSGSVAIYLASILAYLMDAQDWDLSQKTFGLIGCGNVGRRVKKVAESLGMKVLVNDPPRARKEGEENFLALSKVLSEADIVSIHVPYYRDGQDKTDQLISHEETKLMKEGAYIVNSSRGGIIHQEALKPCVFEGRLNAILDVWEDEPNIDLELMNKCEIISSHIAGYSVDGKANGTSMSVRHIAEFFNFEELKNWRAKDLPLEGKVIRVGQGKASLVAGIKEAYDIMDDDKKLRHDPSTFEYLRGAYEPHRDLANYSFKGDAENVSILKNMMPIQVMDDLV